MIQVIKFFNCSQSVVCTVSKSVKSLIFHTMKKHFIGLVKKVKEASEQFDQVIFNGIFY